MPPHLYFKLLEFKDCILSGSTVVFQVLRTEQSKINASVNACWKNKYNGWIKTRYSYQTKTKLKLSTSFFLLNNLDGYFISLYTLLIRTYSHCLAIQTVYHISGCGLLQAAIVISPSFHCYCHYPSVTWYMHPENGGC